MRKLLGLVMGITLVAGFSTLSLAQAPKVAAKPTVSKNAAPAEKPAGVVVQEVEATATVQAINQAKREVTLALPSGETKTFTVGPEVKNLPQVKVGDQVKATYVESLAIAVRESKEPPVAGSSATVNLAAKGAKPGAFVANTQTITAKVTAIDHKTRVVTLTGPKGNSLTFTVGPDVKKLDQVKQGDEVVVSYTESLLLDVVAPEKPAATKAQAKTDKKK